MRLAGLPRLLRSRRGNGSIEFALVVPFLVALGLGAVEVGHVFREQLRLNSAARAGISYAMQDYSTAADTAGIEAAARAEAGARAETLSVASRQFCSCPVEGEVSCSTACSDGAVTRSYVEVAVDGEVAPYFGYPFMPPSIHLSASKAMRLN